MSRGLSPRRRSSGSKGLERTATVSDVSPIAPEDSANAPDVHRSSALGFLLRKNPIACVPDRTRVHWIHEWRVRGDPPRVAVTPRAFYPRRARRLIAKVNTRNFYGTTVAGLPGCRCERVGMADAMRRSRARSMMCVHVVDPPRVDALPGALDARETAPRCDAE